MSDSELAFIDRLRLIATDPAARGLDDDVAVIGDLVLTHDMIAEGVHFLPDDPPASVGWKLVAVNLSDLAGQGRRAARRADGRDARRRQRVGRAIPRPGSQRPAKPMACALVGGDTIALPPGAPRVLGLTAIGRGGRTHPVARRRQGRRRAVAGRHAGRCRARPCSCCRTTARRKGRWSRPIGARCRSSPPGALLAPHAHRDDGCVGRAAARRSAGCAPPAAAAPASTSSACRLSRAFIAERGADRRARLSAATGGDDYALLAALPADFDPLSLSLPARDHPCPHRHADRRRRAQALRRRRRSAAAGAAWL